jgi:hypothetical protein
MGILDGSNLNVETHDGKLFEVCFLLPNGPNSLQQLLYWPVEGRLQGRFLKWTFLLNGCNTTGSSLSCCRGADE